MHIDIPYRYRYIIINCQYSKFSAPTGLNCCIILRGRDNTSGIERKSDYSYMQGYAYAVHIYAYTGGYKCFPLIPSPTTNRQDRLVQIRLLVEGAPLMRRGETARPTTADMHTNT